MKIDKAIKNIIKQEIERLEKVNAEMRMQIEQEINRNQIHIYALQELIKQSKTTLCEGERMKDITYCVSDCEHINCIHNKENISNHTVLHSWCTPEGIPDCPLGKSLFDMDEVLDNID